MHGKTVELINLFGRCVASIFEEKLICLRQLGISVDGGNPVGGEGVIPNLRALEVCALKVGRLKDDFHGHA